MIIVLSSHVAAGDVGGALQTAILAKLGIATAFVPTVLFGRHPGHGAPGGGATPDDLFAGMIEGLAATGAFGRAQAVIAGYFASPGQVARAARAIDAVNAASPAARILVDPVLGDEPGGLYVPKAVAEAVAAELLPRADLLCPNLWELRWLAGDETGEPLALAAAMRRPTLVSSIDLGEEIGVLHADADKAWLAAHARLPVAPRGTGDRLTALFAAALVEGRARRGALQFAVGCVMPSSRYRRRAAHGAPRVSAAAIRGVCPPRFAAVRDAFAANFADDLELGARFALAIEGEIVLDLRAAGRIALRRGRSTTPL